MSSPRLRSPDETSPGARRRRSLPRPVLKWAGGKTQLLEPILGKLPGEIATYYEPFVGGAAVFFALAAEKRFSRAVLADRNPELIDLYRALKRDVDSVVRALERMSGRLDEESYYEIRSLDPAELDQPERAARLIYLNKTGYNGLYRVNRSGQFNVPYGRYKRPRVLDEPNLRAASAALARAELCVADFEEVCQKALPGDAVYFDPPYVPLSKTANFTAYDRHPFLLGDHERLACVFGELGNRGVPAVLSNSHTPETERLFSAYFPDRVKVARNINCQAGGRAPIDEILVYNRPAKGAEAFRSARPRSRSGQLAP